MKKRIVIITIVSVAILAIIFFAFNRGKDSGTNRSTGVIEGIEVNLSPKVAGRISFLCCNEGDTIKEGEIAVKLESDDLMASVEQAKAGVERAKAEIRVAESSIDNSRANILSAEADIKSAESDLEKARVQMELARSEMDRSTALFKKDFISKEALDVSVTAYHSSVADHASSQSKLASAHSKRNAAESQLQTAESQLTSAKASLKQSEAILSYAIARLSDTTITSPLSGNIVFKALEKGETVSPGMTILTIVNMHDLYARVDIDETLIDSILLNARASIRTEGPTGRVFNGTVYEIGRYAEFATQRDVVRGRQDIKTFRVKVRLEDTSGMLKPGMTVDVEMPRKK
jgi:HlyD family secretion protein